MGGECSNLAQLSNPCELAACTQSIQTFSKNTASFSVQALLTLVQDTHFRGDPVKQVFLKLFLHPSSLTPSLYKQFETSVSLPLGVSFLKYDQVLLALQRLEQELTVYGSVIQPIVLQQICPFFTNVYSTGHSCSYSQLEALLGPTMYESIGKSLFRKKVVGLTIKPSFKKLLQDVEFGVIASQVGGKLTLEKVLQQERYAKNIGKTKWFQILFQVLYGVYTLQLAGVTHNDLHAGNVLVEVSPVPAIYCLCKTNPVTYFTFSSTYKAQIYDFDRCILGSLNSTHETGKDFYKVILTLLYVTRNHAAFQKKYVLPVAKLLYADVNKARLTQMLEVSQETFFLKWKGSPLPDETFDDMRPLSDILHDLAGLGNVLVTAEQPHFVTAEQLYYVDQSLFQNGLVKTAAAPPPSMRDLEVAVAQDEYDLAQLKYAALK